LCPTAAHAIRLYGVKRTYDGKGLTIPSQIRYVHYWDAQLWAREQGPAHDDIPASNPLVIQSLTLSPAPKAYADERYRDAWFEVALPKQRRVWSSKGPVGLPPAKRKGDVHFDASELKGDGVLAVDHDVCVSFKSDKKVGKSQCRDTPASCPRSF
jgi:hypothetical protein